MKPHYYALISDISFYDQSPFTHMPDTQTPTFKTRRKLDAYLDTWSNGIDGILSYTITYCKFKS